MPVSSALEVNVAFLGIEMLATAHASVASVLISLTRVKHRSITSYWTKTGLLEPVNASALAAFHRATRKVLSF